MQQSDLFSMDKIKTGVLAAGWSLGLLIAGSDGVFMPWLNGIGLMLFFLSSWFLGHRLQHMDNTRNENFLLRPGHKKKVIRTAGKVTNQYKKNYFCFIR